MEYMNEHYSDAMPVCWKCRGMLDGSCVETCAGCKARACPGCETAWLRSCMENMLREAPTQDARNDSYFVTSEEGPWFENGVKKTVGEWFLALITPPVWEKTEYGGPLSDIPLVEGDPSSAPNPAQDEAPWPGKSFLACPTCRAAVCTTAPITRNINALTDCINQFADRIADAPAATTDLTDQLQVAVDRGCDGQFSIHHPHCNSLRAQHLAKIVL